MNGKEQRDHKSAVNTLRHELERTAETIADATAERFSAIEASVTSVNTDSQSRDVEISKTLLRLESVIDRIDSDLDTESQDRVRVELAFAAFRHAGFWSRLRWLVTGYTKTMVAL